MSLPNLGKYFRKLAKPNRAERLRIARAKSAKLIKPTPHPYHVKPVTVSRPAMYVKPNYTNGTLSEISYMIGAGGSGGEIGIGGREGIIEELRYFTDEELAKVSEAFYRKHTR